MPRPMSDKHENSFEHDGFEVLDDLVSAQDVAQLLAALGDLNIKPLRGGIRRIESLVPAVAELAQSANLIRVAEQHLNGKAHLVRAIYFDKTPENNWYVTWHQDRTVAVSNRFEQEGWGPWTLKDGVCHVQPPLEVLENIVTIRIHLDPATKTNGCLKIVPGSHRQGLIPSDQVIERVDKTQVAYCETSAGGALVMRPHLLHASEKSATAKSRRVLHFEYSSYQLPEGISWASE